jgi:nicotinamidase-related amidase
MDLSLHQNVALLLIDIQKGFDDVAYWGGARNNPQAESHAAALLDHWRKKGLPVFHVKHCSTQAGSRLAEGHPGNDFQDVVAPKNDEPVITKNVNSAFIGTDLKAMLEQQGIQQVVVVGLTTDHCVSTTVRMAANYGFDTVVVSDATATFDKKAPDGKLFPAQLVHETALASLHNEFATVVTTAELIRK